MNPRPNPRRADACGGARLTTLGAAGTLAVPDPDRSIVGGPKKAHPTVGSIGRAGRANRAQTFTREIERKPSERSSSAND